MSLFLDEENNRDFFVVRKEYELSTVYEANKPVYTYLSKVVENDESSFLKRITRYDINGDIIKDDNYEDNDFSLPNVIEDVVLNESGKIQTRIRYSDGKNFISKYEYTEDGKFSSILKLKHDNQAELVKYAYNERGERAKTAHIKSNGINWESETKILSDFPRETTTCIETDGEISNLSYTRLNHKGIPVKNISIFWRNGICNMIITNKDDNGIVEIIDIYKDNQFVEREIIWRKMFSRQIIRSIIYKRINNQLHIDKEQVYKYEYY